MRALQKRIQFDSQFLCFGCLLPGKVLLFAQIRFQVVEFIAPIFPIMNQLPIPFSDDGTRITALVSVMRIMPKQGPFGYGFPIQKRNQTDAIDVLKGFQWQTGQLEDGRIKVRTGNRDSTLLSPEVHPRNCTTSTQAIGDDFVQQNAALVLKVPSCIVPDEFNYLINPHHVAMQGVRVCKTLAMGIDGRLSRKSE